MAVLSSRLCLYCILPSSVDFGGRSFVVKRVLFDPRPNFHEELEDAGCFYHTIDGAPYWTEDAAYEFTAKEVDQIDDATRELHEMCKDLANEIIARGDYSDYPHFTDPIKQLIQDSAGSPYVYGRFDLAFRDGQIKLYEYNADTPTSLPEASIWQWHWLETKNIVFDQFNSIHEKLVQKWKDLGIVQHIHFTAMGASNHEDAGNIAYLMQTAVEAGHDATLIDIEQLGWKEGGEYFVDLADRDIKLCFKLYPWEWMLTDDFGWKTLQTKTQFIEPAWKMLLSTKLLLPALWRKHKGHPLLLESYREEAINLSSLRETDWIRKPAYGREGANIFLYHPRDADRCDAPPEIVPQYDLNYVMQELFAPPVFLESDRRFAVIGSWVIGDEPAGMGIREDRSFVTKDTSNFVPHYFVD